MHCARAFACCAPLEAGDQHPDTLDVPSRSVLSPARTTRVLRLPARARRIGVANQQPLPCACDPDSPGCCSRKRGMGYGAAADRTRIAKLIREQQALAAEIEVLRRQQDTADAAVASTPLTQRSSLAQASFRSQDSQSTSAREASPSATPRTYASRQRRLKNTSKGVDIETKIETWLMTSPSPLSANLAHRE
jgi:hypothetical protein